MANTPCPRCSGRGVINHFMHVKKGVCFRCKGAGTVGGKPVRVGAPSNYEMVERAAIVAESEEAVRILAMEALAADRFAAMECALRA